MPVCLTCLCGRRVIVADDDHESADALAAYLQATLQCEVDTAYDGAQAVVKALARRPEVMVVDIEMPVVDGLETARSVKDAYPDRPPFVVAVSGNAAALRAAPAGGQYVDSAFVKPIDYEQFAAALCEAVSTRAA